jgi:hypothetical protein
MKGKTEKKTTKCEIKEVKKRKAQIFFINKIRKIEKSYDFDGNVH